MAYAGEGDMGACHQIFAFHRLPECQIAGGDGSLLVDVKFDRDIRFIELEDIAMGDIAPEDDFLAVAFQNDAAVARRMAGIKDRAEAGNRRGTITECLELAGIDIGLDAFLRFGITLLQRFGRRLGLCLIKPESGFALVDVQGRIGKDAFAIRRQPAGVVGMDMGEDNIVYLPAL